VRLAAANRLVDDANGGASLNENRSDLVRQRRIPAAIWSICRLAHAVWVSVNTD